MYYGYYDWTYVLVLIGLALGLGAQVWVKSAFAKYSKVRTRLGWPACKVAAELMQKNGGMGVRVERTSGTLTDHYDPKTETLRLSDSVYDSDSVAALGVAAHEAGHALQKAEGYPLLMFRTAIVPVVNIGSQLAWPIFLGGLIFSFEPLLFIGIVLFGLVVLFSLVTLPVELDASRRALTHLTAGGYVTADEAPGVKRVLTAAAMTYVASLISSVLQLLRLILLANRNKKR